MNDNILNLENGQLYLNLSIPLDETYSSYIEALDALYSSLDYARLLPLLPQREEGTAILPPSVEDDGTSNICIHEWYILLPGDREADEEGLRMHEDPWHGQDTRPLHDRQIHP